MKRHEHDDIDGVLSALDQDYTAHRVKVDDTAGAMRAIVERMHRPAEERAAAQQLTLVLRDATAAVVRALHVIEVTLPAPRPRRHVSRAPVEATRPWSTELLRLTDIEVWLRRTTMDDLGVQIPTTVRVGSRAATGPHTAGLQFEPDDLVAATLHDPRIGVDLTAVIDAAGAPPPPAAKSITGPHTTPHAA